MKLGYPHRAVRSNTSTEILAGGQIEAEQGPWDALPRPHFASTMSE